jgi:4-amino-4-deoxy-L-arabinose transferase-like glycosyltransferase
VHGALTQRPALWRVALLYLTGLALWFALLGIRPLFNPDEGRYAEIPREMLSAGDFVLPRLDGLVYLEKPPLQYWLSAAGLAAFGVHPLSARLVPALAAVLGLLAVFTLAGTLHGPVRAHRAVLMAASMLLYVFLGQLLTLDMLLTLWLLVAIAAFCRGQTLREREPGACRRWMLLCWVAMALGTLTKGLVGLVIPGAVLVLYTALARDTRAWRHLSLLPGLALYILLVLPWFLLVERAHPGALQFLIIHEHFQRYLTTVHERYQPWWYFLPILALGTLPWLPQALRALLTGFRATRPRGEFDGTRLVWVAVTFVVVFYSASDSKLAPYVLPCLPLLAVLAAGQDERAALNLRLASALSLALAAALALTLLIYPWSTVKEANLLIYRSASPALLAAAALIALGALISRSRRLSLETAYATLAAFHFLAALSLATVGAARLDWKYSGAALAAPIVARTPSTPLYAYKTFDWTLPVYTSRLLLPVAYRGELDYGLTFEPGKAIGSAGEFATRWRESRVALALVEPATLPELAGLPYRELARTPELVLIER